MKNSPQDAELISRFLGGEADAVRVIQAWLARAAGAFRRRLGGEWDDVLQEVRIETFRLLQGGQYRGEASLRTYLWQVTAHTCLDALRRQKRRPAPVAVDPDTAVTADPSPLDRVLGREREQVLLAALESMSDDCRELWTLVASGLSYREIASRLGVSEGALRVRVHRCRQRAIEALGPHRNDRAPGTPQ
jgi:RNA polymerase sigma-70 factor (ECF subfamily)